MKVLVSDRAKRDLLAIYAYVSRDNPAAAEKIVERISGRFEQLARFPFIGRERFTLAPGLRSLIAGNHLIFYVVAAEQITVVGVIDSRMDIGEEFRR